MGTDIDYNTVSHQTIYQHLTGGAGSIDLTEASQGWQGVAAKLEQLHGDVQRAIEGIGAAQQGASADAATQATMALLPWLQDGVTAAKGIAERIAQQADSFGHTRDNMPPPVNVPEVSFTQDPGTWMGQHAVEWLPGIQTGHEQAQVAAQQAQQRAQELMSAYQNTSNDNLAIPQQFAAAPAVVADVADPSLGDAGTGSSSGGSGIGAVHSGSAHPAVPHTAGAHPAAATPGHPTSDVPAGTPPQLAPATHPVPPAATTPQLAGSYLPGAGAPSLTESGQVRPAPFGPSPILIPPTSGGGHLPGGGSRGLAGAAGTSRAGGFGPRPTPTFSDSHSPTGSAAHAAAEHLGADRSTRGAGFSGAPPGATGGAGRGENSEHRRPSYLLEQDANALIGELPRVAPPVIGAD